MIPDTITSTPSSAKLTAVQPFAFLGLTAMMLAGCGGSDAGLGETAMVLPQTIGEWVRQDDPVTYDRETIFDYINGAGEVYRSYAFSHVDVERYERPEAEGVIVEVFDMGNPDDAFGVFSFAREEEEEGVGAGFERKGSILCFWQDRFYVCVATEERYEDPGPVLEEIARGVSGHLPPGGQRPALVGALPAEGLVPFSDRFFHLHQTLNYHYYLVRENVLNLSAETDAVLARYAPGPTYLVMVRYDSENQAATALSSFRDVVVPGSEGADTVEREGGAFVSSGRDGSFLALVIDAVSAAAADSLRSAALERLRQLQN